ncbi:MAG: N-acetylmuramoyl-L-alanine amidase [Bryobacteraceae bacterium]|nr:N-acetylmuramoyl-L-alanine amidase [Bryobacteraceae bacterium]
MITPEIDRKTLALPPTCYFREPQHKDLIVLGCTLTATPEAASLNWKRQGRLHAAPYLIARDGTIYETFDPRAWSLHLNMPAQLNPTARNDRRSIAVQLVNVGGLRLRHDGFLTWPCDNTARPWCSIQATNFYLKQSFRGYAYFATFTEAQMNALSRLIPWLCREHGIPWQLPPREERLLADPRRWSRFRGILAHHHFRPEHSDVGPAFDWDRISPAPAVSNPSAKLAV